MQTQTAKSEAALGTVIATATMRAAALYLHEVGRTDSVDLDRLTVELRAEAINALHRVLDQGKALMDGGQAGWLEALIVAETTEAALTACKRVL